MRRTQSVSRRRRARRQDEFDVLVGVPKNQVARALERRPFPIVLEFLVKLRRAKIPVDLGKIAETEPVGAEVGAARPILGGPLRRVRTRASLGS
jgi:hypothetical protein